MLFVYPAGKRPTTFASYREVRSAAVADFPALNDEDLPARAIYVNIFTSVVAAEVVINPAHCAANKDLVCLIIGLRSRWGVDPPLGEWGGLAWGR